MPGTYNQNPSSYYMPVGGGYPMPHPYDPYGSQQSLLSHPGGGYFPGGGGGGGMPMGMGMGMMPGPQMGPGMYSPQMMW
jgi:hypothetical protein